MQLVVACAITDEGVVVTAEFTHHVAQGEDSAKDELRIVAGGGRLQGCGRVVTEGLGQP